MDIIRRCARVCFNSIIAPVMTVLFGFAILNFWFVLEIGFPHEIKPVGLFIGIPCLSIFVITTLLAVSSIVWNFIKKRWKNGLINVALVLPVFLVCMYVSTFLLAAALFAGQGSETRAAEPHINGEHYS